MKCTVAEQGKIGFVENVKVVRSSIGMVILVWVLVSPFNRKIKPG